MKRLLLATTLLLAACASRHPVFSVSEFEDLARDVKGMEGPEGREREAMLLEVQRRLHQRYPEIVLPPSEEGWTFNAVGGSLAEIKVLFCSPREYVALWGSPVQTDGFSGRYAKLDVWDVMLAGRMSSYMPGDGHQAWLYLNDGGPDSHQTSFLARGDGRHFSLEEGAYMIDYGRGKLLSALRVGARLGHRNVTGDKVSRRHMLRGCARQSLSNWFDGDRRRALRRYRAERAED